MRALVIVTSLALCAILSACGGGDDQDSREPPDKTIGPVQCPASAPVCTTAVATH